MISTPTNPTSVTDSVPNPEQIRERLSDITAEADFLRGLLRLYEGRECGRRVLQQRCRKREAVSHA